MAGLQPAISTKSLLTCEPPLTSKFDTAANKHCKIYILISGGAISTADEFKCARARLCRGFRARRHSAALREARRSAWQNNEKLPGTQRPTEPSPSGFITRRVQIFNISSPTVCLTNQFAVSRHRRRNMQSADKYLVVSHPVLLSQPPLSKNAREEATPCHLLAV